MEDSLAEVSTCLAAVDRIAAERAIPSDSAAAVSAIAALGRYIDDHATSLAAQESSGQRFWEHIAPSSTTAAVHPPSVTVVSLVSRLTDAVTSSARAPGAKPLQHLVCLVSTIVGHPRLCAAASAGQRRAVYDAALRLLQALTPPRLHIDALAECLHLVLVMLRPADAALLDADPIVRICADDEVRLAKLCLSVCGDAKPNVALRPQSTALQLLGCLLEQATPGGVQSQQALIRSVCERALAVARSLTQQTVPNQTLGEGLLRGFTGLLASVPEHFDATAMALINSIVLSALRLSETSMNYQFCRAALFLLRHRTSDVLAPYTLLCAADYAAALRNAWVHRNKDVRRESLAAVAAFWAALGAQLQRSHTTAGAAAHHGGAAFAAETLRVLLDTLLSSLGSAVDREATCALEALYHLLPAVQALHGTPALEGIGTRLEERVCTMAGAASAAQTEALFRQSPYLLAALGQLFSLLPSVSPRMLGTVRRLLDWVLLLYPHTRFFDRDKTVPGILVAVAALLRNPHTPDHTLPRLLSEGTLELVGEAVSASTLVLAGDRVSCQDRLQLMAQLWAKLLSCPATATALTEAEAAANPTTVFARQRLAVAFFQACTRLCDGAELQVIEVGTRREATLERMLVNGADDVQPRDPAQYRAFLSFVDFFVGFTDALRPPRVACDVPPTVLTAWLESLVRGVRRAPHVSGFYVLVYRTVLAHAAATGQLLPKASDSLEGLSWSVSQDSEARHTNSPYSPLLRSFLRTECLRWVYVYSDELLYQCAMCAVVGVAVAVGGRDTRGPAPSPVCGQEEEEEGFGREGSSRRGIDAYVRAFSVVMAARPHHVDGGTHDGVDVGRFGSHPSLLEENRRYAVRVLGCCVALAPAWAAAVLPALTSALRADDRATAVRASLQMLAARHGVAIAAELQRQQGADTFAVLCRGARIGDAQSGGPVNNIETRRVARLKPVTVPLATVDSAVHVGYLLPLAARLSLHGKPRVVRTAAAEVLHWCVVWAVQMHVTAWETAALTPLLALAAVAAHADGSAVHEDLHRLLMQTARWYGREGERPEDAKALVAVLLGGLEERDAAVRQVATEALLAYALSPVDVQDRRVSPHLAALLPQLVAMASGAPAWARLGAAHCLHLVLRSVVAGAVAVSEEEIAKITQGAVACVCRCVEVAGPGPMEAATCNEVQEMLRCVTAAHHRSKQQQQEDQQHHDDPAEAVHERQTHDWSDTVTAVVALLPALAQLHPSCATMLLSAVVALAPPATAPSTRDALIQGAVRRLRDLDRQSGLARGGAQLSIVTGALAALAALLQSGIVCTGDTHDRTNAVTNAAEWPRVVAEVLQAVVNVARLTALADAPLPDALVAALLQVLALVSAASRDALRDCAVLVSPFVATQAVRATLTGTANTAPRGDENGDHGARQRTAASSQPISAQLPASAQRGLELLRLLLDIAEEARCPARLMNDVLDAFQRARAFDMFKPTTAAHDLTDALRSVADAPHVANTIVLAAALSQVVVSDTDDSVWARVALALRVAPSAVAHMLRSVLQDSAALNAAEGAAVCEALLLLLFNTVHEAELTTQLAELLNVDAVRYISSFTDATVPLYEVEEEEAASGGEGSFGSIRSSASSGGTSARRDQYQQPQLSRAFSGTVHRCWQRAAAALTTPCLVAVLPCLLAVIALPATAQRRGAEVGYLSRVVEAWLVELQRRPLCLERDAEGLRRVCSHLTTTAAETEDGADLTALSAVCRAMVLQLVQLLGSAVHVTGAGEDAEVVELGAALLTLAQRVGTPVNVYRLLSSIDATDRAVWGFQVLAAMLTPSPVRPMPATPPPVPAAFVDAALRYLGDILSNALPLRWAELTSPQARTNGAQVVRAGTALVTALLPHHAGALEPLVPLLAMDDLPHRESVVVRSVSQAIASMAASGDEGQQCAVFDRAARLLRDPQASPQRCVALLEHVLTPLLSAAPASVRLRIFEEEAREWVREAATVPQHDNVQVQTAALSLLALMHRLCPLADLRGAVNSAVTRGNPKPTGRELTLAVLKACRSAWQPPAAPASDTSEECISGGGAGVLPPHQRRYRQAAFRCLVATLAATQQVEKTFCQCLFQGRGVASWNALLSPLSSSAASAAAMAEHEEEAGLWRDMALCSIPELFTHLTRAFGSGGGAPPAAAGCETAACVSSEVPGTWVHDFLRLIAHPQLSLPARLALFHVMCLHASFFGALQPRVWDGVTGAVAATPPSSPAGAVVWELMGHLTTWYQRHGVCSSTSGADGLTPGLQRLSAYACLRLAWRCHDAPETDSSVVQPTRLASLTALLAQLASRTPQPPLSDSEVTQLLNDPDYDRRSALEVLYCVATTCGSISRCGSSHTTPEAVAAVYTTLANFLDAAAHPQLCIAAARLVGLEHHLLGQSDASAQSPAVRKLLRDELQGRAVAVMRGSVSDTKLNDVLEAMQAVGSDDLAYAVLGGTDWLQQHATANGVLTAQSLRVLAKASGYVVNHYDSVHMRLVAAQLPGVAGETLAGTLTVALNALPHLSLEALRHVLRDVCSSETLLEVAAAEEQVRVVFFKTGVAALQRWAVLCEERQVLQEDVRAAADAQALLTRRGLSDAAPAVQTVLLDYLDTSASGVPASMWERLTALLDITSCTAQNTGDGAVTERGSREGWVRHASLLLLALSRRSQNYGDPGSSSVAPLAPASEDPVVAVGAARVNAAGMSRRAWRQAKHVPLFAVAEPACAVGGAPHSAYPLTAAMTQTCMPASLVPHAEGVPHQQTVEEADHGEEATRRGGVLPPSLLYRSRRQLRSRQWHSGAAADAAAAATPTTPGPVLSPTTSGRYPEVRLTLQSLLKPLRVLCLHENAVAARVLTDLISNAVSSPTGASDPAAANALQRIVAQLVSGGDEGAATTSHHLLVVLELVLLHDASPLLLRAVDTRALVQRIRDAVTTAPVAPLPLADAAAAVMERVLALAESKVTASPPLAPVRDVSGWHHLHVALRQGGRDDDALQSAMRVLDGGGAVLQGALDAMEVGGAASSLLVLQSVLHDTEAAPDEVLRYYTTRAARLLLQWDDAAALTMPRVGQAASLEGARMMLRARLHRLCGSSGAAPTSLLAGVLQPMCDGFELGVALLAEGRWLDCQQHAASAIDALLLARADSGAHVAASHGSHAAPQNFLAASAMAQLSDAARHMRAVVTRNRVEEARAILTAYLSTMPTSALLSDGDAALYVDNVLLLRRLVVGQHLSITSAVSEAVQLDGNAHARLVAAAREWIGEWTVHRCEELLLSHVATDAIPTLVHRAGHATLPEALQCALTLAHRRSQLFLIATMPRGAQPDSQDDTFDRLQCEVTNTVRQWCATGLMTATEQRRWAADVAQCQVALFAASCKAAPRLTGAGARVQAWTSALEGGVVDGPDPGTAYAVLDTVGKLLAASALPQLPSLWLLYARSFVWCSQASANKACRADLPVSVRVPRLLAVFRVAPGATTEGDGEEETAWAQTWAALMDLPATVWLPWVTLLVNTLLQTAHPVLKRIVLRLCHEHEQVLFYPVHCVLGSAWTPAPPDLTEVLGELRRWHDGSRMALVADFATALDELVDPQIRFHARLKEVAMLAQLHEHHCHQQHTIRTSSPTAFSLAAQQLYDVCKAEVMDPTRWGEEGPQRHYRAAQVLAELDQRGLFCADVFTSAAKFERASRTALRHLQESASAHTSTPGAEKLSMSSTWLPRVLRRSATATMSVTPSHAAGDGEAPVLQPMQPTHLLHTTAADASQSGGGAAVLIGVADTVTVMNSKQRPKKVDFYTTAGTSTFIVKGGDDTRLDQRIQEVFTFVNLCLLVSPRSRGRGLRIRTYAVVPVSPLLGLIGYVPNTMVLGELMGSRHSAKAKAAIKHFHQGRRDVSAVMVLYKAASTSTEPEHSYERVVGLLDGDALTHSLQDIAADCCSWHAVRDAFLSTNAAAAVASYILGVGDRHLGNAMVDLRSGELVAIDFGLAFGNTTRCLPIPELMPFRHTPQLRRVQGVLGDDVTRWRMCRVVRVVRAERHTVESMVAALLTPADPSAAAAAAAASSTTPPQLGIVSRKLSLENPATVMWDEVMVNRRVTDDTGVRGGVNAVLSAHAVTAAHVPAPSPEDAYVLQLLRLASDPRILTRVYAGWTAYL